MESGVMVLFKKRSEVTHVLQYHATQSSPTDRLRLDRPLSANVNNVKLDLIVRQTPLRLWFRHFGWGRWLRDRNQH